MAPRPSNETVLPVASSVTVLVTSIGLENRVEPEQVRTTSPPRATAAFSFAYVQLDSVVAACPEGATTTASRVAAVSASGARDVAYTFWTLTAFGPLSPGSSS